MGWFGVIIAVPAAILWRSDGHVDNLFEGWNLVLISLMGIGALGLFWIAAGYLLPVYSLPEARKKKSYIGHLRKTPERRSEKKRIQQAELRRAVPAVASMLTRIEGYAAYLTELGLWSTPEPGYTSTTSEFRGWLELWERYERILKRAGVAHGFLSRSQDAFQGVGRLLSRAYSGDETRPLTADDRMEIESVRELVAKALAERPDVQEGEMSS